MWNRTPGRLTENVVQLVTPVSSHFLFLGGVAALVDTGVSAIAENLISQLEPYSKGDFPLRYIFLTHAHFDHVGCIPHLREKFPNLQLIASPGTAELLGRRPHLEALYQMNKRCAAAFGADVGVTLEKWCESFTVNRIVSEGDSINLGEDVDVKVVTCPGHTADCIGYFLKSDSALACAEAVGGYAGRDKVTACFLSSRSDFIQTLDKLLSIDVKVLSLPHGGALSGDLAKRFLLGAREEANNFAEMIRGQLAEGSIKEEILMDLLGEWTTHGISPEGPFADSQEEVARRMIDLVLAETPEPKLAVESGS